MGIIFSKINANQSDYIITADPAAATVGVYLCQRCAGVGADGLVIIKNIDKASIYIDAFNALGQKLSMCENAARAVFEYALAKGLTQLNSITVHFDNTFCFVKKLSKGLYKSIINKPSFEPSHIPLRFGFKEVLINRLCEVNGEGCKITAVNSGLPFCAVICDDITQIDIAKRAVAFSRASIFQTIVNVVFIQIVSNESLQLKAYHAEQGEIGSCGNAAAAALACVKAAGLFDADSAACVFSSSALYAGFDKCGKIEITAQASIVFDGLFIL